MILPNLQGKKVILASASPRRQELIRGLGIEVAVKVRSIDEQFPPELKREQVARFIAERKADAFRDDLGENEIIITGDTTVCIEDDILNKPENREEAIAMIKRLCKRTHSVISAVCILSSGREVVIHDETEVTFGDLTDDEIAYYVDQFRPYDKAGAYGIQEFIGYIGITELKGSYYTVMGFPLHLVYRELKSF